MNGILTTRKAKVIAYKYIHSWITEAERDDTDFFNVAEDTATLEGYDINNPQNRKAILSAFRIMAERFEKEFRAWRPNLEDFHPDTIKLYKKLKAEGEIK